MSIFSVFSIRLLTLSTALFWTLGLSPARAEEAHHHHAGDPARLGNVHIENSCSSAVQGELGRALAMLHSFWYEEAERRFRAVAQSDPRCAIAWWGAAISRWQPLWEPRGPNPEAFAKGKEAIDKALAIRGMSERERGYIDALNAYFANADTIDHVDRVVAYEQAMQKLSERHPDDSEARVFYALSLLGSATSLPPDKTYARPKRAGELLTPVYESHPDHPGAAHYLIHTYDYPTLAAKALPAARRYAQIAPDSPHAQHMPSHIFTRLGLWDESIASNRKVIEVARKHGVVGEELHGMDYLVFAHLQKGEDEQARAVMAEMPPIPGAMQFAALHAHAAIPARYAIERRQWNEAASLPDPQGFPGGRYAWADATIVFARALGAARSGKLEAARRDVEQLATFEKTLRNLAETYWAGQVAVQGQAAAAWLAFAEGRHEAGLEGMRAAVGLEESMDKHPVTPGQVVPARVLLGEMLLEMRRPAEAAAAFTKVLDAEPGRFAALYLAGRASELAGQPTRAREFYAQLAESAPDSTRYELKQVRSFLAAR